MISLFLEMEERAKNMGLFKIQMIVIKRVEFMLGKARRPKK